MLGLAFGLGLVALVALGSTLVGIHKDGSPFKRSFWSA
jgi:hypothetical protein